MIGGREEQVEIKVQDERDRNPNSQHRWCRLARLGNS
jgi:hypothetical protein